MRARKTIDLKALERNSRIEALTLALGARLPRTRPFVASGKIPGVDGARAPWARQFTASGKAVGKIPQ